MREQDEKHSGTNKKKGGKLTAVPTHYQRTIFWPPGPVPLRNFSVISSALTVGRGGKGGGLLRDDAARVREGA